MRRLMDQRLALALLAHPLGHADHLRCLVSEAGWSCVSPSVFAPTLGPRLYAPYLGAAAYPLDEAVRQILAEARQVHADFVRPCASDRNPLAAGVA